MTTAKDPETDWECARCTWLLTGKSGEEVPEHAQQCPFRTSGTDPEPIELEQQSGGR